MYTEQEVIDSYLATHGPYQTRCVSCGQFMSLNCWREPTAIKISNTWWVSQSHSSWCKKCLSQTIIQDFETIDE